MVELREITEDRKREIAHQDLVDIINAETKNTGIASYTAGPADIELYVSKFKGFLGKMLTLSLLGRKVMKVEYAYNNFHVSVYDRAYTPLANRIGEGIENNWAYLYLADRAEDRPPKPRVIVEFKIKND